MATIQELKRQIAELEHQLKEKMREEKPYSLTTIETYHERRKIGTTETNERTTYHKNEKCVYDAKREREYRYEYKSSLYSYITVTFIVKHNGKIIEQYEKEFRREQK